MRFKRRAGVRPRGRQAILGSSARSLGCTRRRWQAGTLHAASEPCSRVVIRDPRLSEAPSPTRIVQPLCAPNCRRFRIWASSEVARRISLRHLAKMAQRFIPLATPVVSSRLSALSTPTERAGRPGSRATAGWTASILSGAAPAWPGGHRSVPWSAVRHPRPSETGARSSRGVRPGPITCDLGVAFPPFYENVAGLAGQERRRTPSLGSPAGGFPVVQRGACPRACGSAWDARYGVDERRLLPRAAADEHNDDLVEGLARTA